MRTPYLNRLRDNKRYPLTDQAILGRHSECDVALTDEPGLSRKHARFSVDQNAVHISDIGSLNGTLVNTKVVRERCQLQSGDRLVFDRDEFEIVIPERTASAGGQSVSGRQSEVPTRVAGNGAFELDSTASIRDLNADEVAQIKSQHQTAQPTPPSSAAHSAANQPTQSRPPGEAWFDPDEKFSTTGVWQNNHIHPDAPIIAPRPASVWNRYRWLILSALCALVACAAIVSYNTRDVSSANAAGEQTVATSD